MRKHEEEELFETLMRKLIRLADLFIARLTSESTTTLAITIQGEPMANYQLNAGDSVVLTVADNDSVTGAVVTPDAGSVSVVLSSTTDTVTPNADGTYTIVAGATLGTDNTATVNATVGGVASTKAVGTYDVVAAVVEPDATTLSVSFGTESAPASTTVSSVGPGTVGVVNGVDYGPGAGQTNPVTGLVNP
jgi:hypothetical protein